MALPGPLLHALATGDPASTWAAIFGHAWEVCSPRLSTAGAAVDVTRRDRELAALDLFLASAGWDLWQSYEATVGRTAEALASWWESTASGRAVLLLDGLSLREVPWLLQG